MSKELVVPDYLKSMMAQGEVGNTLSSMQADAGGVPRLTTRGKLFRWKEGEDEEKAGTEVDVVIIGINPVNGLSHTFYREAYNPNSNEPPDCSSQNGVVPDSWISRPESDKCATCPNQVWGSAKSMSGGKSKACRDSKQILIAKAKDFGDDPEKATLYLMQVTVNSLKHFTNYGKELASTGFPGPQFVITRISMDEESSVPMTHFSIVGALNEKLGKASWVRSEKREWELPVAMLNKPDNSRTLPSYQESSSTQESNAAELNSTDVSTLLENW